MDNCFLPDWDDPRTIFFTFTASGATGRVSVDFAQAGKADDSQQCAVGTQIPAPEMPEKDGQYNQGHQNGKGDCRHPGKEFEHVDVRKPVVRALDELFSVVHGHLKMLLKQKPSAPVQILRQGSYGADPTAKHFAENER